MNNWCNEGAKLESHATTSKPSRPFPLILVKT